MDPPFSIPLTTKLQTLAAKLLDALRVEEAEIDGPLERLTEAFFAPRTASAPSTTLTCPFKAYFALQALQSDGTFIPAQFFTQVLAQFKYLAYTCAIVYAEGKKDQFVNGIFGLVPIF